MGMASVIWQAGSCESANGSMESAPQISLNKCVIISYYYFILF